MNPILQCLIVDDERPAIRLLSGYVEKSPSLALAGTCEDALSALEFLRANPVDMMLLDIHMPDLTGLEMLKSLHTPPLTVLTTAYTDYALQGFELDVVDYLVKPISFARFNQAIERVVTRRPQPEAAPLKQDHFFVRSDHRLVKLIYSDILYIEGLAQYVKIFTPKKMYVVLKTLKAMEALLPRQRFLRVHRSYIVNWDRIQAVYGNTLEIAERDIPIGKSYREDVLHQINALR